MNNSGSERALILELDLGNTQAKWRFLEDELTVSRGMHRYDSGFTNLIESVSNISGSTINEIVGCRVVSVAGKVIDDQLEESWQRASSAPLHFAKVSPECAGVRCGYTEVAQMGVDRWSAVLAASRITSDPCFIIDAGTALTIDVLGENRQHLGGCIFPGVGLLIESLRVQTAIPNERIPDTNMLLSSADRDFTLGASTSDAILGAVNMAYRGYIEGVISSVGSASVVVVTGGHSRYVERLVEKFIDLGSNHMRVAVVEDLVLDGLSFLAPLSEVD